MTIEVNGKQVEAYDLLMKKEYALEILSGKKRVEFRSFSEHYINRFMKKEVMLKNKKSGNRAVEKFIDEIRTDIEYIHFHNYNNSWYLDVAIAGIGHCFIDSLDIESLAEEFDDFKAYIEDAKKNDQLPLDERPMMFYIVIAEVVATNLH